MKRAIAILLAGVSLLFYIGTASAETLNIDIEKATSEEIKAAVSKLNRLLAEGMAESSELPQILTFSNGFTITVDKSTASDGILYVYFTFVHQYDQPINWQLNVVCKAYQNGIELDTDYNSESLDSITKTFLPGGEGKITQMFVLTDDSEVTLALCPQPLYTNWIPEYQYVKVLL